MATLIPTGDTVKVFDLLYLNGQPLINKSTKFRKRNLKACIKGIQGRIELVTESEARTAMDVRKGMEDIMAARGEGLVMKHPDASYILNGRNRDWIKVRLRFRHMDCTQYCRRSSLSTWLVGYRIFASL
jgi:ATP-dependent DNA ligase